MPNLIAIHEKSDFRSVHKLCNTSQQPINQTNYLVAATYQIKPCLVGWGRRKEINVSNEDEGTQVVDDPFLLSL